MADTRSSTLMTFNEVSVTVAHAAIFLCLSTTLCAFCYPLYSVHTENNLSIFVQNQHLFIENIMQRIIATWLERSC